MSKGVEPIISYNTGVSYPSDSKLACTKGASPLLKILASTGGGGHQHNIEQSINGGVRIFCSRMVDENLTFFSDEKISAKKSLRILGIVIVASIIVTVCVTVAAVKLTGHVEPTTTTTTTVSRTTSKTSKSTRTTPATSRTTGTAATTTNSVATTTTASTNTTAGKNACVTTLWNVFPE